MTDMNISKIRSLDGGLLLIFKELVECQNATVVAKRLSLSQSAISHAISRMRSLFDDPLFIRKAHGFLPTVRALEIHGEVTEILRIADTLLNSNSEFLPSTDRKLFSIAAPEYVTALIAGALSQNWAKNAPYTSINYLHISPDKAVQALQRGEIDIAIGRFNAALPQNLEQSVLYKDQFCVAVRRKHPRIRKAVTRKQYENESHVLASAGSEVTNSERTTFPKVPSSVVVGQWITALTIASNSDLLATCHRKLAEQHAKLLQLHVLEPPFKPYSFSVSIIHRAKPTGAIEWLISQIRENIK